MHVRRDGNLNYLTNFLKLDASGYDRQRGACSRYLTLEDRLAGEGKRLDVHEVKALLQEVSVRTGDYQVPSTIWSMILLPEGPAMKVRVG